MSLFSFIACLFPFPFWGPPGPCISMLRTRRVRSKGAPKNAFLKIGRRPLAFFKYFFFILFIFLWLNSYRGGAPEELCHKKINKIKKK
jgi:hypothetical protein